MDFYINLMRANQLAKVHKAECAHCRHGRGHPRQGHRPKNRDLVRPLPHPRGGVRARDALGPAAGRRMRPLQALSAPATSGLQVRVVGTDPGREGAAPPHVPLHAK